MGRRLQSRREGEIGGKSMATTLDGEPTNSNTTRREVRARLGCGIVRTVGKNTQTLGQPAASRALFATLAKSRRVLLAG